MHLGIGIEGIDLPQKRRERGGFLEDESATGDANLLGALFFSGDVGPGGGIFAHANKNEPRNDSLGLEGRDSGQSFPVGLGGQGFSVEDVGGHGKFTMP